MHIFTSLCPRTGGGPTVWVAIVGSGGTKGPLPGGPFGGLQARASLVSKGPCRTRRRFLHTAQVPNFDCLHCAVGQLARLAVSPAKRTSAFTSLFISLSISLSLHLSLNLNLNLSLNVSTSQCLSSFCISLTPHPSLPFSRRIS